MKEDPQHNMTHHLDILKSTHAGISKQNIAKASFKHLTFYERISLFICFNSTEKDQKYSSDSL